MDKRKSRSKIKNKHLKNLSGRQIHISYKNELHLDELNDYLIAIKPEDGDFQTLNGSNENPLKAFSQIIKNNIGKKCNFYIYNKKIGAKDICVNIPNDQMFEMGCDVAFGKLHEFPFIFN